MAFLAMKKKHIVIYAFLGISAFSLSMYKWISLERESENNVSVLLEDIKQKVNYVRLEFGSFPTGSDNTVCEISDKNKISTFTNLLSNVDSKNKSGHILPTLEFRLDIDFVGNEEKQYLGWIYNKHPDDIYLETSLWEATESGSYKRKSSGDIRIPGAAVWINQIYQECVTN